MLNYTQACSEKFVVNLCPKFDLVAHSAAKLTCRQWCYHKKRNEVSCGVFFHHLSKFSHSLNIFVLQSFTLSRNRKEI